MQDGKDPSKPSKLRRMALTARLSLTAYDAITELQRLYRRRTGRHIPLWKLLDQAIVAYAKGKGIKIRE